MVIIEALLGLAVLGAILYIIMFAIGVVGIFIEMRNDPDYIQIPDLPDIEALSEEGWELMYSAEDNDHFMLGQVFHSEKSSTYKVIVSDSANGGISDEMECDSFEVAKELADEWAYAYQEED